MYWGEPIIIEVIKDRDLKLFNSLLDSNKLDINAVGPSGETALTYAFKHDDYGINFLDKLLERDDIDINVVDNEGTPFIALILRYNTGLELFKKLIKRDDLKFDRRTQVYILYNLIKHTRNVKLVQEMLEHPKVNINAISIDGNTYILNEQNVGKIAELMIKYRGKKKIELR